ncbi:Hydrogenase transcriptional regulatory protein hupR1 [Polystyrenella longa]|uniref:Hydrogenase transcriptional regulatory protein hupR1 n=1 Tax=Polystyrenella longa TaxID=2528007 RepID=A0A518CHC7_9PLAN|nr:response regulator [Polystyrenella longa]QDU78574.1 Hydrogenase transcriptional regulatory protein hupR1 [Polystyrenella longa]
MKQPTVFFVDDEQNVLDGLRRALRRKVRDWDLHFFLSADEALKKLEEHPCDAIISDMRMPQMDGASFMKVVATRFPDTIRFILSGYSDSESLGRALAYTHQVFAKPWDADVLVQLITQALKQRELTIDEHIRPFITKLGSLPSLPSLYQELRQCIDNDGSLKDAVRIVSQDVAMTAKILQMMNSSFFGFSQQITSISQAITLLGLENLCSMVLSSQIFKPFQSSKSVDQNLLTEIINHSLLTARLAQKFTLEETRNRALANEAFSAGLLHDIGKTVLLVQLPDVFKQVKELATEKNCSFYEAEKELHEVTHAEVGGYLLGVWGLPQSLIDAVIFHHLPLGNDSIRFSISGIVSFANIIASHRAPYTSGEILDEKWQAYIEGLSDDVLNRWAQVTDEVLASMDQMESIMA